jgi:L-asparaginase II
LPGKVLLRDHLWHRRGELGLGFALKCDNGSEQAAVSMAAALVAKLMKADKEMSAAFSEISKPRNKNWNGMVVGKMKAAGERSA